MRVVQGMTLFWRTSEVFSNWHPLGFVLNGRTFSSSEQYMMFAKAMLFGDSETAERILAEPNPRKQKALGRQVRNYVDAVWQENAEDLMFPGLLAKFSQNAGASEQILATGDTLLVEAAPDDFIWGIGLEESDPRCLDKAQWLGLNKLGKVLTRVREAIKTQRLQPA